MATNVGDGEELVDDLLAAVFGTPGRLFVYWAQGCTSGSCRGFLVGLVSFFTVVSMRPRPGSSVNLRPAVLSLVIAAMLVALLMAGPFSLYEGLVRQIAGR